MSDVHLSVDMQPEGDGVDIGSFAGVTKDFRSVLRAVESSLTNEESKATWTVEDMTGFRAVASPNGVSEETLQQVVQTTYEGFRRVEQAKGRPIDWPPEISTPARRAIRRVFKYLKNVESITIQGDGIAPLTLARTEDKPQAGPEKRGYTEVSQLDGKLDLISVRSRPTFVIEEHVTGERVPCRFPDEMFERAKAALGMRVVVEGLIRYNADDVPTSMSALTDFFVRPKPLRTLEELVGSAPDFTGGIGPVEYVRAMRDPDDA
jgi:hypothetical protein